MTCPSTGRGIRPRRSGPTFNFPASPTFTTPVPPNRTDTSTFTLAHGRYQPQASLSVRQPSVSPCRSLPLVVASVRPLSLLIAQSRIPPARTHAVSSSDARQSDLTFKNDHRLVAPSAFVVLLLSFAEYQYVCSSSSVQDIPVALQGSSTTQGRDRCSEIQRDEQRMASTLKFGLSLK